MKVGAIVTIGVGRWLDRTAKIIEVLTDLQLSTSSREQQMLAPAELSAERISVCPFEPSDFFYQKTTEIEQPIIISYGDLNLVITGKAEKLQAFTEQIQNNAAFVEEVFERALDLGAKNT